MLAHRCKNLSDVESVDFQIRLSIHSPAMDEHVIKIAGCKFSHRSQQFVIHLLNVAGALLSPCGITILSQSIPLGVLTSV